MKSNTTRAIAMLAAPVAVLTVVQSLFYLEYFKADAPLPPAAERVVEAPPETETAAVSDAPAAPVRPAEGPEAEYREAHKRLDVTGTARLGRLLAMRGDPEGKVLLEQAALRNSGEGQYYLAKYHEQSGETTSDTAAEIDKLMRRAAKNGYVQAQFELALAYEFGRAQKFDGPSVVNKPGTAESWHLAAAEQGHGRAQLQLGLIYMEGRHGVERDPAKAKLWLDRAAEQGMSEIDEIENPATR